MIVYDWQAAEIKKLKHKISKLESAIGSWEEFLQSCGLENDYAVFMYDKFGIQEKE